MDTTAAPSASGSSGSNGASGGWNSGSASGNPNSSGVTDAVEAKHEIDSGMMPPPITTQIPMGVRRSSLPSATPMITDQQLVHLNAVAASAEALKTELLDESSSHSPLTGESTPDSPNAAMQYHHRFARKTSLDTIMYDQSNSLPGFPAVVAPATAAAVAAAVDIDPAAVAVAVELAVKNEIVKHVVQQHQQLQEQMQEQVQQQIQEQVQQMQEQMQEQQQQQQPAAVQVQVQQQQVGLLFFMFKI